MRPGIAGHSFKFLYNPLILKRKRQDMVEGSSKLYEANISSDDNDTIMNLYSFNF